MPHNLGFVADKFAYEIPARKPALGITSNSGAFGLAH